MDQQLNSNGKLWLLVEVETAAGRNSYMIVDSDEVIGHPNKDNMHTGKSIYIPRGKRQAVQATIVIISDDKHFLDTELKQLKKMSAENLAMSLKFDNIKERPHKRRRTLPDSPSKFSHGSSSSWISSSSTDPPQMQPMNPVSEIALNTIPPMTFDQQTQTENNTSTNDPNYRQFANLLVKQEKLIDEQKANKVDMTEIKQFILDLTSKFEAVQQNMNLIKSKLIPTNTVRKNVTKNDGILVNSTIDESDKIIILNNIKTDQPQENWKDISDINIIDNEQVFEIRNVEDNQINDSQSCSFSFNDSNQSIDSASSDYKPLRNLNKKRAKSNMSLNSSSPMPTESIADWLKSRANNSEYVPIGRHKTMVPQQVIECINWSQHTAATRKLLSNVFSRDILATHSLTGKPSPAFIDQQKPIKSQLDQEKVSDIIQMVTKFCQVPENFVRNVITTKCADENKMKRQRQEKALREANANKENRRS